MKAIVTRFCGPTNTRGARVVARAEGVPSVAVAWDYGLDTVENHARAARALASGMGWGGTLTGGWTPSLDYAWTFDGSRSVEVPPHYPWRVEHLARMLHALGCAEACETHRAITSRRHPLDVGPGGDWYRDIPCPVPQGLLSWAREAVARLDDNGMGPEASATFKDAEAWAIDVAHAIAVSGGWSCTLPHRPEDVRRRAGPYPAQHRATRTRIVVDGF